MNIEPSYYAIIPADVRYNDKLTLLERFLYCEITALSNRYGYCYATNEYFGELYKKNPSTISRAISKLSQENHIHIEYEKVGTKKTNRKIYPLTQKTANDIIVNGNKKTNDIFVNGELGKILKAIDEKVKLNNITYLTILNTIKNIGKKEAEFMFKEEFEQFWKLYPKKKEKQPTLNEFKKKCKSKDDFEKIMNGVKNYNTQIEINNTDYQYIKYPKRWIRDENYLDEYNLNPIKKNNYNYNKPQKEVYKMKDGSLTSNPFFAYDSEDDLISPFDNGDVIDI